MSSRPTIVWFRRDLRVRDNPALTAAAERGPVVPVFVWSDVGDDGMMTGAASKWWLHHSLMSLDRDLRTLGLRLIIRRGSPIDVFRDIVEKSGATAVFWNRLYEPSAIRDETEVERAFPSQSFNGSLLREPWEVETRTGGPYKVFTPYWRACEQLPPPTCPSNTPDKMRSPETWPESLRIDELGLLPKYDWASGLRDTWNPGEASAHAALTSFVQNGLTCYDERRDRPDRNCVSLLSPYLHFGELSPRQVYYEILNAADRSIQHRESANTFLREIGWREFTHHILYHFPNTIREPLRSEFTAFPWRNDPEGLRTWQQGQTGYPIVDAGMRQLWSTGWMHNRVRMITASFLVKDLLVSWECGADWLNDTLVDADLANNIFNWQWVAGTGADAAPYFRIFNPVTQGTKFDPNGDYVRRWVPELRELPAKYIHAPWDAPADVLEDAGVSLGRTYPRPIIDHSFARNRALDAFNQTVRRQM